MKTIKTFLFNRFNILFPLLSLTALCIILLAIRSKSTHSFFYLFLAWNLFLAMVPFFISMYAKTREGLKKYKLYSLLLLWLLFLPNAPYIITDFIHLRLSPIKWLGFDALMIAIFAVTGIAFYLFSVKDIEEILFKNFNRKMTSGFLVVLPFLVGFGIYLGRVLRWNSWDILHKPSHLFTDIFEIFTNPLLHFKAWLFTFLIGFLLKLCRWTSDKFLFNTIGF
ncbi:MULTISPECIES: DUF1361 domain-containing protein [Aequorivita]|uniref:DUF1361 domain-containing protein n=2 Tax=Aequorivita TaxID=153265 RepID=A0AB35YTI1_9FLAO|nr:DUF1361 domain-containing protein [Aequorivita sp. Ant34-E75]WGF91271.1 DUF1361 domain-containing protein [Aequorivita sp. Ant34-E75]